MAAGGTVRGRCAVMLRQPRRLASAGIAIVLGVAFITTALLFGSSLDRSTRDLAAGQVGDASLVVSSSGAEGARFPTRVVGELAAQPGVTGTRAIVSGLARTSNGGAQAHLVVQNQPPLSERTRLTQGRLATADDEAVLSTRAASSLGSGVGDHVTLRGLSSDEESGLRVVGIIEPGTDAVPDEIERYVFSTDAAVMRMNGDEGYDSVMIYGGDPQVLKSSVSGLEPVSSVGAVVRTGAEETQYRVDRLGDGTRIIKSVVVVFGVISLFVSLLVIANTFSILVSQRSRQLAMMRCVGATKGQVLRTVIAEALALGVIGSAVGVCLGYGLARLMLRLGGASFTNPVVFSASTTALIAPFVVGVVVTVLSSIGAARRATAVAPLAALHPELAVGEAKRLGPARAVVGALLIATGAALLILGWTASEGGQGTQAERVLMVMGGALVSFLGVIVLGRGIIPALAGAIGAPLGRASLPGRIAVSNSRRNPGRAAATANALLIGVTLISTLTVGAATSQATIDQTLGDRYPIDASVSPEEGVDQAQVEAIRAVNGVAGAELVPSAQARLDGNGGDITVLAVGPEAARISRASHSPRAESDDQLLTGEGMGLSQGQRVTLHYGEASVELTARIDEASGLHSAMAVTPATLARLAPDATSTAWVRYADDADASAVTRDIGKVRGLSGAVTSGAEARAGNQKLIDAVLIIATSLLAVAVIIAVVGVGNTLSLSVLERTQELGLLRALGMTRGQVRSMVAWESVALAAVATVIGLVLGGVYGIIGCKGVIANEVVLVPSIPWARMALIAAVALLAGWLASLVPASRAVKVAPSAALSTE